MAISDAQKVDLLYKKYFGVAKTDTSTNKGAGNESIPSSVFVRNDKLWYQSQNIPAIAANVPGIVRPWLGTERIALAADTTTTAVSNVFPTWKANLINWIPPEFGATYAVKIYAENGGNVDPSGNTSLSDSGIGSVGEWNFDYQSGVLNFIGGTIPAVLTGSLNQTKVLYLTGYQYIGAVGAPSTTDIVANIANVVLSIANISQSITQLTNRFTANIVTTGTLNVTSNIITLLSNVVGDSVSNASITVNRGTNADVALRWEEEIDRWQFTNDGNIYYNLPTPSEYDNVIYSVSVQTSNVGYSANLRLTGTKSNGNVLVIDDVTVKGTGLVRVTKQDNDTIIIDAGIAPIIVAGIDNTRLYELTRFSTDLYRTAKYIYTTTTTSYLGGGPEFAAGELLLLHNGSNVFLTQYGMLVSPGDGDDIVGYSANINNGNVILYGQAVHSGTTATVKLTGTTYTDV
jgi:hypothetical protein